MTARQRILLSDPWNSTHSIDCVVRGNYGHEDPAIAQRLAGRGGLEFKLGEFSINLRPSSAELRALASAMLQVADDLDNAAPALRATGAAL